MAEPRKLQNVSGAPITIGHLKLEHGDHAELDPADARVATLIRVEYLRDYVSGPAPERALVPPPADDSPEAKAAAAARARAEAEAAEKAAAAQKAKDEAAAAQAQAEAAGLAGKPMGLPKKS